MSADVAAAIHAEISAAGDRIVLMAAGPLFEQAYAAKVLQTLTPAFDSKSTPGAITLPLTWPAVVQLSSVFGQSWCPGPKLQAWAVDQLMTRAGNPNDLLSVPIPEGYTVRPYQADGALLIARTGRALLFDEPRTGKSVTAILGLAQRALVEDILPIIVVCPAGVVDPFVELFRLLTPYWKTVRYRGTPKRRAKLIEEGGDVFVTSYDTAVRDAPDTKKAHSPLLRLEHQGIVVDEFHFAKNPSSARSWATRRLARHTKAFVGLSGTPITHNPADLWPTLEALTPGAWGAKERFVERYCLTTQGDYKETVLGLHPWTEAEFRTSITGQNRRVARQDVMSQLPPKVYSVRTVEIPAAYRKAYDDFEANMIAEMPDGQEISVMDALSQLQHLSRMACGAADVRVDLELDEETGVEKRHVHIDLKAPSWKVDVLMEILEERRREKSVAFAVSSQLAKLAGAAAEKAGHSVGYIVGGQSQKVRTETIKAFQHGDLHVVCATVGAGGTGITLSAAGTLAFLQRPWSLVESLQAEDRGEGDLTQTRGTEIIDIVAANTIDTRVREVLREKAGQLSDLLQDPRIKAQLLGGSNVKRLRIAS